MINLKNILFLLKTKIRYSALGKKITDSLINNGTADHIYHFFDALGLTDAAESTRNMSPDALENSRMFFSKNKAREETICSYLADDKSRLVFSKAIKYRQTLCKRDKPPYSILDQYFVDGIITLSDEEVFLDCGAYAGDTISKFLNACHGRYKKIVAFEPDIREASKITNMHIDNCDVVNAGVWNSSTSLSLVLVNNNDDGSARIEEPNVADSRDHRRDAEIVSVNVLAIDETELCNDCTFIKMDVEGSELKALAGAEKTIRKNRPKLAICIYHSDDEMLRIPEWIHSLGLGYRIYVRHHLGNTRETVLYAIP